MVRSKASNSLKKRDMGITGLVIVLVELFSSYSSTKNTSSELKEIQKSFAQLRVDQEKYFVRKDDFKLFEKKIADMKGQLIRIDAQIKNFRSDYASTFRLKSDLNLNITDCGFKFKTMKLTTFKMGGL